MRAAAILLLCALASPAYASKVDDVQKELFTQDGTQIKPELRACKFDNDCVVLVSMCRYRTVNRMSEIMAKELSASIQLECKWPPLPPEPPIARCKENLCEIPSDGRFH